MDRQAEFIKANKQLLGKELDYIALDRKYIKWLEQKLASAEAENASHNTVYTKCECSDPECDGVGYYNITCDKCGEGLIF